MDAVYLLARRVHGILSVAQVNVTVVPSANSQTTVEVAEDLDPNSYRPKHESTWFEAALKGCWDALTLLQAEQVDTKGLDIRIKQIGGTDVGDTYPEVVRVAACMATLKAFHQQGKFQAVFDVISNWKVVKV